MARRPRPRPGIHQNKIKCPAAARSPSPTSACPPSCARCSPSSGITTPFPIQTATLPDSLAGRDVLGRGRTGSGKTTPSRCPCSPASPPDAAPPQARPPRAPHPRADPRARHADRRRHRARSPRRSACAPPPSSAASARARRSTRLRRGVDIVVACPGRLEDLIQPGPLPSLDAVEITVLDEADHMADLGFLPVVTPAHGPTPAGRPAHAVLGHPRQAASTCREALPHRPGHPQVDSSRVARWPR